MARVIVLGAGFGGHRRRDAAPCPAGSGRRGRPRRPALGLRDGAAQDVGDRRRPPDGARASGQLADLRAQGIDVRQGTVEALDPVSRRVTHRRRGARGRRDRRRAGCRAGARARCPASPSTGSTSGIGRRRSRAHDALASLAGGRLLVGVFGTPYACPPGPYELALLADEQLKARGAGVAVEVFGPMPIALPVVGPIESAKVEALLDAAGIPFHRGRAAVVGRGGRRPLRRRERARVRPAVRRPAASLPAGARRGRPRPGRRLGRGRSGDARDVVPGRVRHRRLHRRSSSPTGCRSPRPACSPRPRATWWRSRSRLAAGGAPDARFAGDGVCYAEVAGGLAIQIQGRFLADPPAIEIAEPSEEHMAGKVAFEAIG